MKRSLLFLLCFPALSLASPAACDRFYRTWIPAIVPPPATIWWKQVRPVKIHHRESVVGKQKDRPAKYKAVFVTPYIRHVMTPKGKKYYKPTGFFKKRSITFEGTLEDEFDSRWHGMIALGKNYEPQLLFEASIPRYLTPEWINRLYKALTLRYGQEEFGQPPAPKLQKIFRS